MSGGFHDGLGDIIRELHSEVEAVACEVTSLAKKLKETQEEVSRLKKRIIKMDTIPQKEIDKRFINSLFDFLGGDSGETLEELEAELKEEGIDLEAAKARLRETLRNLTEKEEERNGKNES